MAISKLRALLYASFLLFASTAKGEGFVVSYENTIHQTSTDPVHVPFDLASDLSAYVNVDFGEGGFPFKLAQNPFDLSIRGIEGAALGVSGDDVVGHFINGQLMMRDESIEALRALNHVLGFSVPYISMDTMTYNQSALQGVEDVAEYICPSIVLNYPMTNAETVVNNCRNWLEGVGDPVSSDLIESFKAYYKGFNITEPSKHGVNEELIHNMYLTFLGTLLEGRRLIIYSYSQGNFYVRDALHLVAQHPVGRRLLRSVGVIMIGSPVHPIQLPASVSSTYVANCGDEIALFSLYNSTISLEGYGYLGFSEPYDCVISEQGSIFKTLEQHDLITAYIYGTAQSEIIEASRNFVDTLPRPHESFWVSDTVVTTDNLNVRSDTLVDPDTLLFTANSNSDGTIVSVEGKANGYFWYNVCFQNGCGFVASNWLQLTTAEQVNEAEDVVILRPTVELVDVGNGSLEQEFVEQRFLGTYDYIPGPEGCVDCSNAPGNFEITSANLSCYRGAPRVRLRWSQSSGVEKYHVFRDGGTFFGERTYTTYTDRSGLVPGESFTYTIQALKGESTRNADNAYRVDIPWTICGGSEPPPPYNGPVPSVTATNDIEVGENFLRVSGEISRNDIFITSVNIEYGTSSSLGQVITTPSIANANATEIASDSFPIACDNVYHYRFAVYHDNGVIYSNTRQVDAPSCSYDAPYLEPLAHDVLSNAMVLTWNEPNLTTSTRILVETRIDADPNPDADIGNWTEQGSQLSGLGTWHDTWLNPSPGGKYCYRIRYFNPSYGSQGYSPRSNIRCITIEGVLTYAMPDFPNGLEARVTPGQGIGFSWQGGTGSFELQRSVNGGVFSMMLNEVDVDVGVTSWNDADVQSGNTYCYRFGQNGHVSESACATFVAIPNGSNPTIMSAAFLNAETVRITYTAPNPQLGYFRVVRLRKGDGWLPGASSFYSGSSVMTVNDGAYVDFDNCYILRQYINGATYDSSQVCIGVYTPDNPEPTPNPEPPVEEPIPEPQPEPDPPQAQPTLPSLSLSNRRNTIQLSWSGGSGEFSVERNGVVIGTVSARNRRYTDSNVSSGSEYCYQLTQGNEFSTSSCIVHSGR